MSVGSAKSGKRNITKRRKGGGLGVLTGAHWSQAPALRRDGETGPHLQMSAATHTRFFWRPWISSGTLREAGVALGTWPWAVRSCVPVCSGLYKPRLKPHGEESSAETGWSLVKSFVTSPGKGFCLLNFYSLFFFFFSCLLSLSPSPLPCLVLFLGVTSPSCHLPYSSNLPRILKSIH